jgi:exopolysaccharide biosynthesis polyprenyl glycosylphosphotransferase
MNADSSCQNTPPSSSRLPLASGDAPRDDEAPAPAPPSSVVAVSTPTPAAPGPVLVPPMRASSPSVFDRNEAHTTRGQRVLARISKLAPGVTSKLNLAADCALVIAASAVSTAGRGSWHHTALVICIAVGVWMLGARVLRHYDAWSEGLFGELAVTSVLVISVAVALHLLNQVPGNERFSGVGTFLLLTWPALWFVRTTVVAFRAWRHSPPEQVLVIGTGPLGRVTGEDIRDSGKRRQLFGYLSWTDDNKQRRLPAPPLGKWDELENCLKQNAVAEVYIAGNPAKNGEAMQACIRTCERFGVPFALPAYGFRLSRARPVNGQGLRDGYVHFLNIEHKPVQMVMKRLFDVAASAVALWLLSPIILVAALLIKLTSPGPIFFKQERVGMHGRTFFMLKFRSMVQNAEELKMKLLAANEQNGPVFKIQKDPRITPVGRFIRKFSIDELPQLINVLRGEMSIVGPRPPLPSEVAQYEPWQRRRLSVRPGLTCLWQVSGRNKIGFQDWMYLDMQYIDHWSLGQDFNLILKTVPVVLTGKGAS